MRIDVAALTQGTNKIETTGDAESLDLTHNEVTLDGPVAVELTLNVYGEDIRIDGVIRAKIVEECSRCLVEFTRTLEAEMHLYAAAGSATGRGDALEDEEAEAEDGYLVHDGRQLDLRDEVRSAILLSCPMQPLCSPDCKGLCPECGGNLNNNQCSCGARRADPRWKGLEKLRGQ
jgi:uncharacterized protein